MVARPEPDTTEPRGPADAPQGRADATPVTVVWRVWRRALSRAFGWRSPATSKRALEAFRPALTAALTTAYVRRPVGALRDADAAHRRHLVNAGVTALALGAAVSLGAGALFGTTWPSRAAYVGWLAAWALVRLLLLRLTLPRSITNDRRGVEAAWGAALLPYVFAWAAPLDILALAGSAWLTFVNLEAIGTSRRDAVNSIAWAFGGQLAVEFAAWLARGWLFLLLSR
ncbi:MAG: hypothetical protein Q7W30_08395 [Coriobacteriia bacterium]|nr:hypothetical protein [Coriobacteriia bacterium]